MLPVAISPDQADATVAFASQFIERQRGGETTNAALVRALERSLPLLTTRLSRWFGVYGARALVRRALVSAQAQHPALAGVSISEHDSLEGIDASVRTNGSAPVAEGFVSAVAGIAASLGRLIGEDLAVTLLEECTPDGGRAAPPRDSDTS